MPIDLVEAQQVNIEFHLTPGEYVQQMETAMKQAFECVRQHTTHRVDLNSINYNRQIRATSFTVGEQVWLSNEEIVSGISKKLLDKWIGPYVIIQKINESNYMIKPVKPGGRKQTVNKSRLKRHIMRAIQPPAEFKTTVSKPPSQPAPQLESQLENTLVASPQQQQPVATTSKPIIKKRGRPRKVTFALDDANSIIALEQVLVIPLADKNNLQQRAMRKSRISVDKYPK